MPIDSGAVQAVLTGVFGALSAFYYRRMNKSKRELNGHAEDLQRLNERVNKHSRRLVRLEEHNRDLEFRLKALEDRRAPST